MTKIGLRNAWFQVHKWIGLALAILTIPLCVTGAALVWDEALDHGLNPQRYAISGSQTIDPQLYVEAARRVLAPETRVSGLTLPGGDGPVVVTATPANTTPQSGPAARVNVWLDPPTARVLDQASSQSGLIRTMHIIHGTMLVPVWGRSVVGGIGVAMLFSCFTGLWLWWPTVGKWVRGLRWRRHRNFDTNLHHLFGFWIALPLFVLSLTGAWISFPGFFGSGPARSGPDRAALARAKPLEAPRTSLDIAIAAAQAALPGDIAAVAWPTDFKREWTVTIGTGAGRLVKVDDATGAAKASPSPREDIVRLMRRIHDGTRMGFVWQLIIFLGGLLPAALAVTGVVMWWRARSWKVKLKVKQKAREA